MWRHFKISDNYNNLSPIWSCRGLGQVMVVAFRSQQLQNKRQVKGLCQCSWCKDQLHWIVSISKCEAVAEQISLSCLHKFWGKNWFCNSSSVRQVVAQSWPGLPSNYRVFLERSAAGRTLTGTGLETQTPGGVWRRELWPGISVRAQTLMETAEWRQSCDTSLFPCQPASPSTAPSQPPSLSSSCCCSSMSLTRTSRCVE